MKAVALTFVALAGLAGCTVGGGSGDTTSADVGDQEPLVPADDSTGVGNDNVTLMPGDQARVCDATALNLRSGPSTSDDILKVMPNGSTATVMAVQGTWIQLDWTGAVGWSSARYLCAVTTGTTTPSGDGLNSTEISRDSFISIAAAAVGFSYYWGGGRLAEGADPGACYGSCPSCRHEGSYGADCSGYIGKTWLLPAALPMDSNKHPYTTASFAGSSDLWGSTSRDSILPGDAMVYRSGGSGHIVLYEKDDPWGQFWSYEARGCSYGIVHNIRTAGSAYKAIRRRGL